MHKEAPDNAYLVMKATILRSLQRNGKSAGVYRESCVSVLQPPAGTERTILTVIKAYLHGLGK